MAKANTRSDVSFFGLKDGLQHDANMQCKRNSCVKLHATYIKHARRLG